MMSGWLEKKSTGWGGGWNKRFFKCHVGALEAELRYYVHQDDADMKGHFPVDTDTQVRHSHKDDKPFGIEMITNETHYYMSCPNDAARDAWIGQIEKMSAALGQNATNWRMRVAEIYQQYEPSKMDQIDNILSVWEKKEAELCAALEKYYRSGKKPKLDPHKDVFIDVIDGVKKLYREVVRPVESAYLYDKFYQPLMRDSDFEAKPMVLLLGQYSVGKTTFIRYLLQRDFLGIRIGPEPTTDRFHVLMHGNDDRIIPGNALSVNRDMPFTSLTKFGSNFLNRFEGCCLDSPLLKRITLIDTPGVLSGEKQRINRSYDFPEVIRWFATRADRILVLFDAHKLDISDEFKNAIEALYGCDDKVRIVLNKADSVTKDQLVSVYGALLWSLGKVFTCPEVPKVYIGSFWDKPINVENCGNDFKDLFMRHRADLLADLRGIPRNATIRKINELVMRTRVVKVHAHIIGHLYDKTPSYFGRTKTQNALLADLPNHFNQVRKQYGFPSGDFPDLERFRDKLEGFENWHESFRTLDEEWMERMDDALSHSFPKLMKQLPSFLGHEDGATRATGDASNPFDKGASNHGQWAIDTTLKKEYDNTFFMLPGSAFEDGGLVRGGDCVNAMTARAGGGLGRDALFKIWGLCDPKNSGTLDDERFAVALYLIDQAKTGAPIPNELPEHLIPPKMRDWDSGLV
jgi:GTPase SAR1 family protein